MLHCIIQSLLVWQLTTSECALESQFWMIAQLKQQKHLQWNLPAVVSVGYMLYSRKDFKKPLFLSRMTAHKLVRYLYCCLQIDSSQGVMGGGVNTLYTGRIICNTIQRKIFVGMNICYVRDQTRTTNIKDANFLQAVLMWVLLASAKFKPPKTSHYTSAILTVVHYKLPYYKPMGDLPSEQGVCL